MPSHECTVIHIHYKSSYTDRSDALIAEVNIRSIAKQGDFYQYTSHPEISSGIMQSGYAVTGKWIEEGWDWRDLRCLPKLQDKRLLSRLENLRTLLLYLDNEQKTKSFSPVEIPLHMSVAGYASVDDMTRNLSPDEHPFDYPYYWAGFVVTGK